MFQRCPLLKDFLVHSNVEEIYQRFLAYKMNIPVCGAILLNPALDKVLMVRGWTSSSSWTFPKGKINQDEEECSCAVREVLEETGFDCSSLIQPTVYIEVIMRGEQSNRLYIITNIPETTEFCPRTRKEIGDIKWHRLTDLPGYKQQGKKINKQEDLNTKYFMISKIVV
jgi:8-oxo-dGTP pyrophosphatase MutT (NUDIX family)